MPHYTSIDVALAAVAIVVIPALSAWNGRSLGRNRDGRRPLVGPYSWIILRGLAVMLLVVVAWLRLGRPFAELGFDAPIGRRGLFGFGLDVAIAAYYSYAILVRTRSAAELQATRERLQRMRSDRMLPESRGEQLLFPVVAIVGSSFEELVYRGFLIWFFAPLAGLVGAVFLSAVSFGLGHAYLGRLGIVRTAGIGLVFGVAYALTRSLWWLMLAHVMVNLLGLPLQRRLRRDLAMQGT